MMASQLPQTKDAILSTGVIDPEFEAVFKARRIPPPSSYTIDELKEITDLSLPHLKAQLKKNRPSDISESEYHIPLPDGYRSRLLVCHKSALLPGAKSPLIVIFHGGGHCVGNPESEIPLARRLALEHDAVVVLPCYRLAPENPFPASITDAWATLQYLASESLKPHDPNAPLLPSQCDPASSGFIVAGTSAGANLAATLAHLARDQKLEPKLTGQMLAAGTFISLHHVPARYQPFYLAREQNKDAPLLDEALYNAFQQAFKPDHKSPLYALFDQHHPLDQEPEDGKGLGVKHGHMGLPPTYLQICGLDVSRDDGLIYERVLREECGVKTRANVYPGFPHCWWAMFSDLESSKQRLDDTVQGVGWLLETKE
jgi:acetyl esterase/lipase